MLVGKRRQHCSTTLSSAQDIKAYRELIRELGLRRFLALMALIAPGTPAPDFRLIDEGGRGSRARRCLGRDDRARLLSVRLQPGLCTDKFQVYEEVLDEFEEQGAKLYGVSCDATWSQKAFKEQLGVTIPQLSRTSSPRARRPRRSAPTSSKGGFSNRTLVIVDPEGVVQWSHEAANPGRAAGREPHLRRSRREGLDPHHGRAG